VLIPLCGSPLNQKGNIVSSFIDLTGRAFGKWTVLEKGTKRRYWVCQCECGLIKECYGTNLASGHSNGCLSCVHPKRLAKGQARFNALLHDYKHGAEDRGLTWELSDDQAKGLMALPCRYCGKRPEEEPITRMKYTSANRVVDDFLYNGIDRVDNKLGYTEANSVTCCKICNRAKSSLPVEVFLAWIQRLRVN